MDTRTYTPQTNQVIVTLEDGVALSEIKKVLLLIRGVAAVRMAHGDNFVTPALRTKIRKARKELADGETIVCSTPEEMQQYFDSL